MADTIGLDHRVGDKVTWADVNDQGITWLDGTIVRDVADRCEEDSVAIQLDSYSAENKANPNKYECQPKKCIVNFSLEKRWGISNQDPVRSIWPVCGLLSE